VRALRALYQADLLLGAAHITGGGLIENPPRMFPAGAPFKLQIRLGSWDVPPVFGLLARGGGVAESEMLRTFNMGIGMLACVPAARAGEARRLLEGAGERVFDVGEVAAAPGGDVHVELLTHEGRPR
jgi:phosphoribosylformylglycinamidine cyclo-ligase